MNGGIAIQNVTDEAVIYYDAYGVLEGGRNIAVRMAVYKPVLFDLTDYGCRVIISSELFSIDEIVHGVNAVQALEQALYKLRVFVKHRLSKAVLYDQDETRLEFDYGRLTD